MRAVFLTRVATETVGGLGGAIAQISKTVHSLTVVGPPGIRHFIASLRGFIRGVLGFSLIEYQPKVKQGELQTIYKDENITVTAFPVTPTLITDKPSEEQVGSKDDKSQVEPSEEQEESTDDESPVKPSEEQEERTEDESPQISKAMTSLGLTADEVRRAAVYHMFKNSANTPLEPLEGEAIADDSERWIPNWLHEKQLPSFSFPKAFPQSSTLAYAVIGPRPETSAFRYFNKRKFLPRPVVIILDVPSPDFIPSIRRSFDNEYAPFASKGVNFTGEYNVKAVYHMLGRKVIFSSGYFNFLRSFPLHTKHFISSPEISPDFFTFPHNAWRLYQLARLDSEMFPHLKRRVPTVPSTGACLSLLSTEVMRPGLQIRLDEDAFATGSIVYNLGSKIQTQSSILQQMRIPDDVFRTFLAVRRNIKNHPDDQRTVKRISAKVVCLGTGRSPPSQFRNVVSTLLLTPDGHIMLDCGEGTVQQLERRDGYSSWGILRDIKCIFISHAHADHHLGLIHLLRRRKLNWGYPPTKPLYIVASRLVHLFLKEYQELEDIGLNDDPAQTGVIQIISDALNYRHDEYPQTGPWRLFGKEPWLDLKLSRLNNLAMCEHLNLASFETIDVRHKTRAFGALIRHKEGWSVTYSGDTMPTLNLVKLGIETDLLIHEASFQTGEEKLASERAHSTVGQAIAVGRDMGARNVLLTHLRSDTIALPPIQVAQEYENTDMWGGPVVGIAHDLMEIDLDKFWKANIYSSAIAHCHKRAVAMEKKSVAELLLELVPEESLVCSPNIEYRKQWPWKSAYNPVIDRFLCLQRQPRRRG